jgi:hypothetical protein
MVSRHRVLDSVCRCKLQIPAPPGLRIPFRWVSDPVLQGFQIVDYCSCGGTISLSHNIPGFGTDKRHSVERLHSIPEPSSGTLGDKGGGGRLRWGWCMSEKINAFFHFKMVKKERDTYLERLHNFETENQQLRDSVPCSPPPNITPQNNMSRRTIKIENRSQVLRSNIIKNNNKDSLNSVLSHLRSKRWVHWYIVGLVCRCSHGNDFKSLSWFLMWSNIWVVPFGAD